MLVQTNKKHPTSTPQNNPYRNPPKTHHEKHKKNPQTKQNTKKHEKTKNINISTHPWKLFSINNHSIFHEFPFPP